MIYEYRVYEAAPGKLDALHARFRNHTLGIFERHGIKNIGYWTSAVGDYSDRLIYIVAFEDEGQRERAWASFRRRPRVERGEIRFRSGWPPHQQNLQHPAVPNRLLPPPVTYSQVPSPSMGEG